MAVHKKVHISSSTSSSENIANLYLPPCPILKSIRTAVTSRNKTLTLSLTSALGNITWPKSFYKHTMLVVLCPLEGVVELVDTEHEITRCHSRSRHALKDARGKNRTLWLASTGNLTRLPNTETGCVWCQERCDSGIRLTLSRINKCLDVAAIQIGVKLCLFD